MLDVSGAGVALRSEYMDHEHLPKNISKKEADDRCADENPG